MARLQESTAALERLAAAGADAAAIRDQADAIEETVAWLFAHCRLPPEPDAALHHLLAAVLDAAGRLRRTPDDPAPLAGLRDALAHYPQRFAE